MIVRRVGVLTRTVPTSLFSSSSATPPKFSSFFSDEAEGGSAVYRHALKFQRPTTIKWQPQLENSVSFIGAVVLPLQIYNTGRSLWTRTLLQVKNPPLRNHGFRIQLVMRDDMAKLCQKHLKPDDFVYVSGRLESYGKADENGNLRIYYKVNVKDLNYVARNGRGLTCQKSKESKSGEGEDVIEKNRNQHYLWHLYFSNPYEWWDNREKKLHPRSPDFRHKDTGEALWLSPNDPPWIKRQLQLLDSKMTEQGQGSHVGSRSRVSVWVYDE